MRILLIQRYFWPDVGVAASVLRAVAERLVRDGHDVTVLSAMPSYNDAFSGAPPPRREVMDGYRVIRLRVAREGKGSLWGRAANMIAFTGAVAAHVVVRGRGYDVMYTSSTPPVVLTAAVRWVARLIRRPYVYHCQDVSPEAALVSGILREGWSARIMAHADRANVRRAAAVIVLSSDMAKTLQERSLACGNVRVINNFFVDFEAEARRGLSPELKKPDGVFRVLFAGNLGLLQGLDTVLEAARNHVPRDGVQFALVGAGASRRALEEAAGPVLGSTVVFYPHQPLPVVVQMMMDADLGLVILAPRVYRVAYPSKTMAYLEAGCPILAAVEQESELASFVVENDVGVTCPPGDPGALAGAILRAQSGSPVDSAKRARIREVGRQHFGRERMLDLWSALFAHLDTGGARSTRRDSA